MCDPLAKKFRGSRILMLGVLGLALIFSLVTYGESEGVTADPSVVPVCISTLVSNSPSAVWKAIEATYIKQDYWAIPLDPPASYYAGVCTTDPFSLRNDLHDLIKRTHLIQFPYSTPNTPTESGYSDSDVDTWDIIVLADAHPQRPFFVLDLYKNATYSRVYKGPGDYNREHSWPKSRGFSGEASPAYTDCHHLFACDGEYNSSCSNSYYDNAPEGTLKCTTENLGRGGTCLG